MAFCSTRMLVSLSAILIAGTSPSAAANSIHGRWLTDDHSAIVSIEKCGDKLCGVIEKVLDPNAPKKDIYNPDPRKRSSLLTGTKVLRDFVRSGDVWKDGQAYDPKAGKTYSAKLELLDAGTLKVTGCLLFLCRTRHWNRAN